MMVTNGMLDAALAEFYTHKPSEHEAAMRAALEAAERVRPRVTEEQIAALGSIRRMASVPINNFETALRALELIEEKAHAAIESASAETIENSKAVLQPQHAIGAKE